MVEAGTVDTQPTPEAPRSRAVDEGMVIARSALVLSVKNHLIVGALRSDRSLDQLDLPGFTRSRLTELVREQTGYADRIRAAAEAAATAHGAARHQHDYHAADITTLAERGRVYRALAATFDRLRDDEEFVSGVVESARADAWTELSGVIASRLDVLPESVTAASYSAARAGRMRAVRKDVVDLDRRFSRWD
jgi:hypothetical protein